jgi:hypothetical protein
MRQAQQILHVACTEFIRNARKILVGRHEEKRPLRRHKCRRDNNIKGILKKQSVRVCNGFNWFGIESNGRFS